MTTCKHHWFLGSSVNNFETNLVITPGICKLCGAIREFQSPSLGGMGVSYTDQVPDVKGVPDGFHLIDDRLDDGTPN